jgi:hypothetical protein
MMQGGNIAKRKRGFTQEKYEKWLKEGRGSGIMSEYKPWLTIQDVPSKGRSTRLKGIKTGRQHEFLSDMERNYFYLLEFSDDVIDIREQYPLLDITETMSLADETGIKHPVDPTTKEPVVLTTDFLITVNKNGKNINIARTIKSSKDLDNRRQIEKFELERIYWKQKGVDWGIVTEKEIDVQLSKNISIVHSFYELENLIGFEDLDNDEIRQLVENFYDSLNDDLSLKELCSRYDKSNGLDSGSSSAIIKYLIIRKKIRIDMTKKFSLSYRVGDYITKTIYEDVVSI